MRNKGREQTIKTTGVHCSYGLHGLHGLHGLLVPRSSSCVPVFNGKPDTDAHIHHDCCGTRPVCR